MGSVNRNGTYLESCSGEDLRAGCRVYLRADLVLERRRLWRFSLAVTLCDYLLGETSVFRASSVAIPLPPGSVFSCISWDNVAIRVWKK